MKFIDKHFVSEASEKEQQEELYDLSRKFKLKDRIKKKRNHSNNSFSTKKNDEQIIYEMDSGKLIVAKENDIIESYESDKAKYMIKHHYAYQTFREFDLSLDTILSSKSTYKKLLNADGMLNRLYKSPKKDISNEFSRQLADKYQILFTNK